MNNNNNINNNNNTNNDINNDNVKVVQLDGLVLLKIIKHCKEAVPEAVSGQLLGLQQDNVLEVTNCFGVPSDNNESNDDYQIEMLKQLQNAMFVDNNTVGWYQSSFLSGFLTQDLVDNQFKYQSTIPSSVVIIFDPFRTTAGHLALKAYRLSDVFMKLYEKKHVDVESMINGGVSLDNILVEVPVKVHNSYLAHGFLYEIRENKSLACENERLSLQTRPFLEKNLDELHGLIDDYNSEQQKYLYYQRQVARNKAQQQQYIQEKRKQNEALIAAGKEPSPEEDYSKHPLFKPLSKPSRLESMLVCKQLDFHTEQMNNTTNQAFHKAYVLQALQSSNTKK